MSDEQVARLTLREAAQMIVDRHMARGIDCRPSANPGERCPVPVQGQHEGRAFEIRTKRDLAKIAPKRRTMHGA